eukprot:g8152.t1
MEHRYNSANYVDGSLKISSHEENLRITRRQSVHMVLNDKEFMESILKAETGMVSPKKVQEEDTTCNNIHDNQIKTQKLHHGDQNIDYNTFNNKINTTTNDKSDRLMTMSEIFVTETEMDRLQRELEKIPTHQKPHHRASPGSIQLHLARLQDTKNSKPQSSWLNHTVKNHKSHNTVWNNQIHKSEYTKHHVKHPKPKQLQRRLNARNNVNFNRILKKKINPVIDSDDINYYKKIFQQTRGIGK